MASVMNTPGTRPGRRPFRPEEAARLVEAGILRPDEPIEWHDGIPYLASGPGRRLRFRVEDYDAMARAGILRPDERVELIDGEIFTMSPIGDRHAGCVNFLNALLSRRLAGRAIVSVQNPIRLLDHSEPQPDLAILVPRPDFYRTGHPGPEDVLLIIEVVDSTSLRERGLKLGDYALAGLREVWIVDLDREFLEVHRRPEGGVYTTSHARHRGQNVACDAFPDVELGVDEILG